MSFTKALITYLYRIALVVFILTAAPEWASARDFVLTLDPGHGGRDYGAVGKITNEKTVVLSVGLKLGRLIEQNLPYVKVVYTRDTDVFIPLNRRAEIANNANSDLFMSIHINSVDKRNRNRANIEGCQVYTLGLHKTAENLEVAKRENAVMELEADHTEKYAGFDPNSLESDIIFELSQNKRLDQSIEFADALHQQLVGTAHRAPKGVRQAGFWVLWATSAPAVLVELDFICNPRSEKYLASESGQEEMVASLYNSLCAYLNTYGSGITGRSLPVAHPITPSKGYATNEEQPMMLTAPTAAPDLPEVDPLPANPSILKGIPEMASSDTPLYYVQLLASSSPLSSKSKEFQGLKDVVYYREGALYKYAVGGTENLNKAKKLHKQIKKQHPGCFIVKMQNGKRIDFIKP